MAHARWARRVGGVRLDVAEHDADAGEQDDVERDQDGGVADVGVLQAERDDAPERRQHVERQDGAPFVDAERHQAMREVIAATVHGTAAGQAPRHAHERRVEDRNEQDEERNRCDRDETGLELGRREQRRAAEKRSQEQAAAVPHEDRCRPHVVDQESQRRADEGRDRQGQRGRT